MVPPSQFDDFSDDYDKLVRDPLRDRFAGEGKFFFERKWRLLRDFFARRAMRMDAMAWLDVGCGRGDLLRLGAGHFREAAGCDVSAGMIGHCEGLNVRLQEDPGRLPFDAGQFDFLTAVCVFHHVPVKERAALLGEFRRVLRPGGTACIIEHNPWNPVTRRIVARSPVDAEARLLTAPLARRLMREAGLLPLETAYFLYFPQKIYDWAGSVEDRVLRFLPLGGQYAVFGRMR